MAFDFHAFSTGETFLVSCNVMQPMFYCYIDPDQTHPYQPYHPHSAATKNQLQQRREFTADLDTKPGDKTIDGAASLVRKTCEKMTSCKLETSIQTVPFQFISTLICLIMFDIQGGDILEDTYQTREELVLYIYTYTYIN